MELFGNRELFPLSSLKETKSKQKMETLTPRRKRSEPLTQDEFNALKKYRKSFHTQLDCAEAIGIRRELLNRVLIVGSSSPETVEKIRLALANRTL